ncbi:class I SAM-dependent methyltransferase [Micromonospora sp. WMMD1102]|uniref:class I SAM-dependent methyltransferase n=1 Tax=Micromonospora sp. WMMD1102 TaxID=3016105 RepID=UPI00241582C1|nr:class I SAM-dependent methyltransferase [Micromonospora sp. WMMD1102]MDG4786130.1 class I SAM-dependent methyltransferase [Micromonospora sp. WMMD1102]
MHIVNTDQAEAWNGPEAANWAARTDRDDPVNGALTETLLDAAAIEPGDRVLDIGCGTGDTTRRAASRAAPGRVLGVDLSALMLDRARVAASTAGLHNVEFAQGDVQVYPFPGNGFDVAISQFGVMFFAEPVAAFRNVHYALRPGGRLAFVCPRAMTENAWYVAPMSALYGRHDPGRRNTGRRDPDRLPDSAMFSLADPDRLTNVLSRAGFTDVQPRPVDAPMAFGADVHEAAQGFLGSGPVLAVLQQPDGPSLEEAREILVDVVRPYEGPDGVRIPGASWLVTAHRP